MQSVERLTEDAVAITFAVPDGLRDSYAYAAGQHLTVRTYLGGEEVKAKPKLAAWFAGQVQKQTGGKANPAAVNAALKTRLNLPDEG